MQAVRIFNQRLLIYGGGYVNCLSGALLPCQLFLEKTNVAAFKIAVWIQLCCRHFILFAVLCEQPFTRQPWMMRPLVLGTLFSKRCSAAGTGSMTAWCSSLSVQYIEAALCFPGCHAVAASGHQVPDGAFLSADILLCQRCICVAIFNAGTLALTRELSGPCISKR